MDVLFQASSGAPIMIPEMEELIMEHNQGQQNGNNSTQPNGESCSCNCSSSGYSSATNYNNGLKNGKIPAKPVTNSVTGLSAEHLKLLRQLSDTSDLSKKVMGNLEQCMLVMYQQEEYRLGESAIFSSAKFEKNYCQLPFRICCFEPSNLVGIKRLRPKEHIFCMVT